MFRWISRKIKYFFDKGNKVIIKDGMYYKFSFFNDKDCDVLINSEKIHLSAREGFDIEGSKFKEIHSFVVVTPRVKFQWTGKYRGGYHGALES